MTLLTRTVAVVVCWIAIAAVVGAMAPHPAVCRVAVEERDGLAFGSGTLIDARERYGLVVTNWHVVRDASGTIEVRFPSGFRSEARPLKLDETWDLAALVIWRPPTEPATLAARPPQPGDRLTICGYGQGDYRAVTGRCTDYYSPEIGQPQELVELDVEARQGDSGGPIFNDRGELAGVLFGAAQGTTLGSFGGRVQAFLATLAPDIGRPSSDRALIAESPTARDPRSRPVRPATADPFVLAEKAASRSARLGTATSPSSRRPGSEAPPPSLSDRATAPAPVVARRPRSGWFAPSSTEFVPQRSSPAEPARADAIDWEDEGRSVLAMIGVAALVVVGMRTLR